jgi:23S rRNA pseudouridine1911/1915/1917 synthase
VRQPIGPVPHPRLGSVHAARPDGRAAVSQLAVAERRDGAALLDVRITTGRPHQIRIHCAWTGHPLAGDPLYAAGGGLLSGHPGLPGDGGYLLHAWRLRCAHPSGHGDLAVEAPVPAGLERAT